MTALMFDRLSQWFPPYYDVDPDTSVTILFDTNTESLSTVDNKTNPVRLVWSEPVTFDKANRIVKAASNLGLQHILVAWQDDIPQAGCMYLAMLGWNKKLEWFESTGLPAWCSDLF